VGFLKLMLVFTPWLCLLVIGQGSLLRLKIGLVTALVASVVMSLTGVHRGIIMVVGLVFFTCATVAVVLFDNIWTAVHMGMLAHGALALSAWGSVAIGRPFTMDYARQHTDPSLWTSPPFIRTNVLITSVWALAFTLNVVLGWGKLEHFLLPELAYDLVSYALLIGAMVFSNWYPAVMRRRAAALIPRHADRDPRH